MLPAIVVFSLFVVAALGYIRHDISRIADALEKRNKEEG